MPPRHTVLINDLYIYLLIDGKYTDQVFLTREHTFQYLEFEDPYSKTGITTLCLDQSICELFNIPFATIYDYRTNI